MCVCIYREANIDIEELNNAKKVKVSQSCPTLCDSMDYTVHVILQAKILEWIAFPFSSGSSQPTVQLRSPALQADSSPVMPQEGPNNANLTSTNLT